MTPAEIRTSLLAQLDAAPPAKRAKAGVWVEPRLTMETAIDQKARAEWGAKKAKAFKRFYERMAAIGYLTLKAGPSTHKVLNTAVHRERFRKRVITSAGFKDNGQKYREPARRSVSAQALTADEIAEAQT